ncbi:putative ribonuclease H-like domain-containing protein [Tanacetum coccineum]
MSKRKHTKDTSPFPSRQCPKGNISIEKDASEDANSDILSLLLKRESFKYLRLSLGMMEHIPCIFLLFSTSLDSSLSSILTQNWRTISLEHENWSNILLTQIYAFWEVNIVNGDAPAIASASVGTEGPIPPKTAKQKLARKNELKAKNLEQIDTDDLEEMDLKWQVAMLTIRVKRFLKKTRRNLNFNGKETVRVDKIKVEWFNSHNESRCKMNVGASKWPAKENGKNVDKDSASDTKTNMKCIDHTTKDMEQYMLKKFDYVDLQGRLNGYSRHITRIKSFLTDYQEIDGGFVAFGGSPKGGKITGKGKIRTGKLDFEDTECLGLSPDFKLLDESQVLLKVPRQNNMYSFDLKNVVPSGGKQHKASWKTKLVSSISQSLQMLHMNLFGPTSVRSINHKTYCLVVTDDYSRFSWVFFLATKDETSGILKTFITGIENQINHKVKIIRCDNRTEFKSNDMNQICGMKGIKREFSVARTPQQNEVAKRKNMTLIEAARTMLVDSLLPTTFWAEAVSTACYVQNKVLVTKPHNKTPYELLHGRPPSISFMRTFGCPVTILNTLDPLGKFDGKADEGFFVGYSINSKAFRVFNTRTRKLLPQSSEDAVANDAGKKTNEEPANEGERNGQEKEGGASNKEDDQNVQDLIKKKEAYANSTNRVSIVSPSVSAAKQSFINVDDLPTDPLMPDLEDTIDLLNTGIFSGAYDDEDVVWSWLDLNILGKHPWNVVCEEAFFIVLLKRRLYVCQPPGFEDPQFPNKVYKVEKALYGLYIELLKPGMRDLVYLLIGKWI